MSWLGNRTIKTRITFLVGICIFSFLIFFFFSDHVARNNLQKLEQVAAEDFPAITRMHQVDLKFLVVRDAYTAAVNDVDGDALQDAQRLSQQLRKEIQLLSKSGYDGNVREGEDSPENFLRAYEDYVLAATQLAEDVIQNTATPERLYSGISQVKSKEEGYRAQFATFEQAYIVQFKQRLEAARLKSRRLQAVGLGFGLLTLSVMSLLGWWITRSVTTGLSQAVRVAETIAAGDWEAFIAVGSRDETGQLLEAIHSMRDTLRTRQEKDKRVEQRKTQLAGLNECMRGQLSFPQLCSNVLNYMVGVLDAPVGAFYVYDHVADKLQRKATHALQDDDATVRELPLGESLLGQAAREGRRMVVNNVPADYMTISSGLIEQAPRSIVMLPIAREQRLLGILELGSLRTLDADDLGFLDDCVEGIAISLLVVESHERLRTVLEQAGPAEKTGAHD